MRLSPSKQRRLIRQQNTTGKMDSLGGKNQNIGLLMEITIFLSRPMAVLHIFGQSLFPLKNGTLPSALIVMINAPYGLTENRNINTTEQVLKELTDTTFLSNSSREKTQYL